MTVKKNMVELSDAEVYNIFAGSETRQYFTIDEFQYPPDIAGVRSLYE
jgi:hypothetical protein